MALAGALNGTLVYVRVRTGSQWLTVGGQLSHSVNSKHSSIDITSKQQGQSYRELLNAKGLKTLDISCQLIFSTDTAFDYMKAAHLAGTIELFQVVRSTIGQATDNIQEFSAKISSWNEVYPDNDKSTVDVTLESSGSWVDNVKFESVFASTDGQFITSNSDNFLVRAS